MKLHEIENIEVELLLEAIFQRYGYDFRGYARASIRRRIKQFMEGSKIATISEMIPRVIHDESLFNEMVREFSITVTEMFRDPAMFLALRENVLPVLKSYPYIKIWHAGCATGEEAYSLTILIKEYGLAERATIFATDFNDHALSLAKTGIYDLNNAKQYSLNYQKAGGNGSFADYYHSRYDAMMMNNELKKKITFANHNLVVDQVFSETHLIFCRNVLIYFNRELQDRVLQLFHESLVHGGFLCLGTKESLMFSRVEDRFKTIDKKNKIFQKID
ncbi:MAG: protein-glutamate O-methyltransferase CheR [Proteobacteria bacterium]|nr:protein-glutamate O-methyltransferase CheR [Pseudomonadota bacterium]MBU1686932.1 protein-glutamate O-methyltransferase CheR [Pseudomonadota bacterium]